MATWKSRFEDIVAEVENKTSPSEVRRSYLNKTLGAQLWEEMATLRMSYESGTITQEEYYQGLDEIEAKLKEAKEHINKVNFHEDI